MNLFTLVEVFCVWLHMISFHILFHLLCYSLDLSLQCVILLFFPIAEPLVKTVYLDEIEGLERSAECELLQPVPGHAGVAAHGVHRLARPPHVLEYHQREVRDFQPAEV